MGAWSLAALPSLSPTLYNLILAPCCVCGRDFSAVETFRMLFFFALMFEKSGPILEASVTHNTSIALYEVELIILLG